MTTPAERNSMLAPDDPLPDSSSTFMDDYSSSMEYNFNFYTQGSAPTAPVQPLTDTGIGKPDEAFSVTAFIKDILGDLGVSGDSEGDKESDDDNSKTGMFDNPYVQAAIVAGLGGIVPGYYQSKSDKDLQKMREKHDKEILAQKHDNALETQAISRSAAGPAISTAGKRSIYRI